MVADSASAEPSSSSVKSSAREAPENFASCSQTNCAAVAKSGASAMTDRNSATLLPPSVTAAAAGVTSCAELDNATLQLGILDLHSCELHFESGRDLARTRDGSGDADRFGVLEIRVDRRDDD